MEQVGVKELKAHASEILRRVEEEGKAIEIARRGKVVARLVPIIQASEISKEEREKRWDDLFAFVEEIRKRTPAEVSAVDMINDVRREL
jgi:prevent-host-death family protein